ncbi:hypothetical protein MTQ89_03005 [Staphylococcus hyicus]|uniref:hypothetical protein n=1 Tax=Staphylococcus hyicus TaxID=1284 RepID=UPI00208FC9EB|nr:hypothetical protein [Staphylococcus hyicus]MCO4328940.1 hypothetical protein [Staphylococcus hyicus]MCO4335750.1 hypothetical protein [Staphylococcus hyicus]
MKSETRIIDELKKEMQREDKVLKSISFEVRASEVTMFFEYNEPSSTDKDPHYMKHGHDPEFLDIETFENIKAQLPSLNVNYTERRDEFM